MLKRKVIYLDETSCHLWMRKSRVWQPMSSQEFKLVIPANRGQSITIFGAITTDGEFFYSLAKSTNMRDTTDFIK